MPPDFRLLRSVPFLFFVVVFLHFVITLCLLYYFLCFRDDFVFRSFRLSRPSCHTDTKTNENETDLALDRETNLAQHPEVDPERKPICHPVCAGAASSPRFICGVALLPRAWHYYLRRFGHK